MMISMSGEQAIFCALVSFHKPGERCTQALAWGQTGRFNRTACADARRQGQSPAICGRYDAAHPLFQQWFNLADPAVEEAITTR